MSIKERVLIRKPDIKSDVLEEFIQTATDRINLRLGLTLFPPELESIAVEVVCALYNRQYHEGIKSENVDSFSLSFVEDIMKEYEPDFHKYLEMKDKQENINRGVLRFL